MLSVNIDSYDIYDAFNNRIKYIAQYDINYIIKIRNSFDIEIDEDGRNSFDIAPKIHFFNNCRDISYAVQSKIEGDYIIAQIPNKLLKQSHNIFVNIYRVDDDTYNSMPEGIGIITLRIPVFKRKKIKYSLNPEIETNYLIFDGKYKKPNEGFFSIYSNKSDHVTQWDINRIITINNSNLNLSIPPEIHFCNKHSNEVFAVKSIISNNNIVVSVPNVLLTMPYPIFGYIYTYYSNSDESIHGRTVAALVIPVQAKAKPSDYIEKSVDPTPSPEPSKDNDIIKGELKFDGIIESGIEGEINIVNDI